MPDKSKLETHLEFLSELERGEVVTQMSLSKRISASVGLVNALLKRAIHKGLVKAKSAPYKRYAYYLTPQGFAEKSRLVAEYLEVSLDFFRRARNEYADIFSRARTCGMKRVSLVGSGELVEIAILAAREADVEIESILDRSAKQDQLCGLRVVRDIDNIKHVDGVVLTESRLPQDAFEIVAPYFSETQILIPPLLNVTRQPIRFETPSASTKGDTQ